MGSNNHSASDAAAAQQAARTQSISNATNAINGIYSSPQRQQQYTDFLNAVRTNYTNDANKQQAITARQTKFAAARNGLTGGSADVDAQTRLGQEYAQGLVGAESKAQGALAGLKAQDNSARLNLTQLAASGLDVTSAAQQANAGMQQAADAALSGSTVNGLGDIFGAATRAYQAEQTAAAQRAGYRQPIGSLYGTSAVPAPRG
jgi:hypothetical protein